MQQSKHSVGAEQNEVDEDDSWRAALNLEGAVSRMGFYGPDGQKLWMVSQVCLTAWSPAMVTWQLWALVCCRQCCPFVPPLCQYYRSAADSGVD